MLKLYVGCALTEAPPEFRESVEELKEILSADYEVLKFLGLVAGDAGDVFRKDIIENTGSCNFLLVVGDHPSWGAAMELTVATMMHKKPVLFVIKQSKKLSRIIPGAAEFFPNLKVKYYQDLLQDVPKLVRAFVEEAKEDMWDHHTGVPLWTLEAGKRSP